MPGRKFGTPYLRAKEPETQDQDVSERCFAAAQSSGQRHQGVRD